MGDAPAQPGNRVPRSCPSRACEVVSANISSGVVCSDSVSC